MSGGGGQGGFDPLQTAVILGASIAAPYAAPALFGAGAGLGTIALTGAGIGGLGSALLGRDPIMGALGGGLGGLGAGAAGVGGSAATAAPSTLAASTAPTVAGTGATLAPSVVPGAIGNTAAASGFAGAGTLGGAGAGTGAGSAFGSLAAPSSFGVTPVAASNAGFLGASGAGGAAGSGGILGSMGITPKMAGYGAGALGVASLMNKEKKQFGQPSTDEITYKGGPLSKFTYDPNTYKADEVRPPLPTYQATYAAGGGLMGLRSFAKGGSGHLGGYSDGARVLKGPGDGMSDSIPATIEGKQPARLADSEFVVPADVVSHLGNGSSDAGAKKLYTMMDRVRKARTGKVKQARRINPNKYLPA